jgi:excisionase family DNA binding protein
MSVPKTLNYLSTEDLSVLTGKSADFWARLCKAGTLPAVKLGNEWRVEQSAFEAFMRGGQQATARPGRTARQKRRSA